MKHLTVDEIMDFVSLTELNSEAIRLSAYVNGHIRQCEKCLNLVRAFQMIYDEFSRLCIEGNFKDFVIENLLELKGENEQSTEVIAALDEIERLR